MNKCIAAAAFGLVIGMYIGFNQEDEIEDLCHKSRRKKKKMMKQFHKTYDHVCDCMDAD